MEIEISIAATSQVVLKGGSSTPAVIDYYKTFDGFFFRTPDGFRYIVP
jgi:hypothetical protein